MRGEEAEYSTHGEAVELSIRVRGIMTARGNERRDIFRDDVDRRHFVTLLAQLPERFGVRMIAWVLMNNHYHLLLETPEG